jgi:hypothetical protein
VYTILSYLAGAGFCSSLLVHLASLLGVAVPPEIVDPRFTIPVLLVLGFGAFGIRRDLPGAFAVLATVPRWQWLSLGAVFLYLQLFMGLNPVPARFSIGPGPVPPLLAQAAALVHAWLYGVFFLFLDGQRRAAEWRPADEDAPVRFTALSWVFTRTSYTLAAMALGAAAVGASLGFGRAGAPLVTMAWIAALGLFLVPTQVVLEQDRWTLRWLWVRRDLAYADLVDVLPYGEKTMGWWDEEGVTVTHGGETLRLPLTLTETRWWKPRLRVGTPVSVQLMTALEGRAKAARG